MSDLQKKQAQEWFERLRTQICEAFEALEILYSQAHPEQTPGQFVYTPWTRESGGGGVMAVMKGNVFEKVGVNVSTVWVLLWCRQFI